MFVTVDKLKFRFSLFIIYICSIFIVVTFCPARLVRNVAPLPGPSGPSRPSQLPGPPGLRRPTRPRGLSGPPGPPFFSVCGIWPGGPVNTHGIGMPRLVKIMEQRPDLCDELIIDGVIGLASHSAEGFQGSASLSSSHYSAVCGQQRANSRSNIHHGGHTSNYSQLNGADFTNKGGEKRKPGADHRGHLGEIGQRLWLFGRKKLNGSRNNGSSV